MALRRDEQDEGRDWQQDAACRGEHAGAFFPPPHFERKELRLARERVAKAICRSCPVSVECLEYAISTREPHGVWGGLNEIERRHVIERRATAGDSGSAMPATPPASWPKSGAREPGADAAARHRGR